MSSTDFHEFSDDETEANRSIAHKILSQKMFLSMSFPKPNRRKREEGIKPYKQDQTDQRGKYKPPTYDIEQFATLLREFKQKDSNGFRIVPVPASELETRVRRLVPRCRPI
jgi:hypothetical protein